MSLFLRISCCFGIIVIATPSGAQQAHPCDAPQPTAQTVSTARPSAVQVCVSPALVPEQVTVYVDGKAVSQRPLTLVQGPNSAGLALYEGPKELTFLRGATVTVQVSVWNRAMPGETLTEGPKSSPLACTAVDDVPPAVVGTFLGVKR